MMRRGSLAILSVLCLVLFGPLFAVSPVVVKGSILNVGGSGPGNYTTIQDAIDNALPGDFIFVHNGTYYENIVIDKPLSLDGENSNTTSINGGSSGNVVSITASYVNITGFNIEASGYDPFLVRGGIRVGGALESAHNCKIFNVTLSGNQAGVVLASSRDNVVMGNYLVDNGIGIYIDGSHSNIITENTIADNGKGVSLFQAHGNIISNNMLIDNRDGLSIRISTETTVTDNEMIGGGILVEGSWEENWNTHWVENTNTVNGKPVIYRINATGGTISVGAGQVLLVNCTDMVITGQNLSDTNIGIQLAYSSGTMVSANTIHNNDLGMVSWYAERSTIVDNDFTGNGVAIRSSYSNDNAVEGNQITLNAMGAEFHSSDDNTVVNNTIASSEWWGLDFWSSADNIIYGNNVSFNGHNGIRVIASRNFTVTENGVIGNDGVGISLENSSFTRVYHNIIIDNEVQGYDNNATNEWDNGYPSGGNLWGDYSGSDGMYGPNQDIFGWDSIGDAPYDIPGGTSKDRYPIFSTRNPTPECTISAPTAGERVAGSVTIEGTAFDKRGEIIRVEIKIDDGGWFEANGTASWDYELDTSVLLDGDHILYACSFDGTDYSTTAEVTFVVDNHQSVEDGEDWTWLIVASLVAIVLIAVILFLFLRRGNQKEEDSPMLEQESSEED